MGVQSCLRPVAAGHLLLPCKSDGSVAQLVSGMKKGPEFTVVNGDVGDAMFGSKTLLQGWSPQAPSELHPFSTACLPSPHPRNCSGSCCNTCVGSFKRSLSDSSFSGNLLTEVATRQLVLMLTLAEVCQVLPVMLLLLPMLRQVTKKCLRQTSDSSIQSNSI